MGSVLDMARADVHKILTQLGFETQMTLKRGDVEVQITGLGLVHHLAFDTEGQTINSKTAHVTITEKSCIDASFSIRNSKNDVYMRDVLVSFADCTGVVKTYAVKENFADDSLGVIVLNLGNYVA